MADSKPLLVKCRMWERRKDGTDVQLVDSKGKVHYYDRIFQARKFAESHGRGIRLVHI